MNISAAQLEPASLSRGRPTKFTPERIQQICNLVERGKSRDEIAEIMGVTTGTLQVTCSKLGISLRRPTFNLGTGLLVRRQPRYQTENASPHQSSSYGSSELKCAKGPQPIPGESSPGEAPASAPPPGGHGKLNDGNPAIFAIRMEYKGQQRSTGLPLDEEMIGQLAMEAEIRGMRIGELVAALILEIVKQDLFQVISDEACSSPQSAKAAPPSGGENPPA